MAINERLAILLKELKNKDYIYNDADFAKKIGISRTFLSDMKSGTKAISEQTVLNILNHFNNINHQWLLTGEGDMLKSIRVIDRFDEYIKHKGLTDIAVIKNLKWSQVSFLFGANSLDTVRKAGRDITIKGIENILNFYTDINPAWLKTGSGSMLIDKIEKEVASQNQTTCANTLVEVYEKQLIEKENQINTLQKENKELNKQVGHLEGKLDGKEEFINILKEELRLLKKNFPTPNVRAAKHVV